MAWFWTDDLARAAIDGGLVSRDSVQDWLDRPVAVAAEDGADLLGVAADALGLAPESAEAAAGAA